MHIGEIVETTIIDQNTKYYFSEIKGNIYKTNKDEFENELELKDTITGFCYENNKHELQITTNIPDVRFGHFGIGIITDIRRDLGVFVDIGLPNKDIVVSLDKLPTIKKLWPQRGDQLILTLDKDNKDRLWGELISLDMLQAIRIPAKKGLENKNISGTVFRLKMVGTYILTDEYYFGFIHPSERIVEPRLGEQITARVIGTRDDGVLNLSLKPRSYESIDTDAQMILEILKRSNDKFLPYNDKSNPDIIKSYFNMSKGQFKRAIGNLMKNKIIKQNEKGILLIDED